MDKDKLEDSFGIIDSKDIVESKIYDNAKEKAKKQVRLQEVENIIRMTLKAGVPKELIGWNVETFRGYWATNVNRDVYKDSKKKPEDLTDMLYDIKSSWPRRNITIIVDGGTKHIRKCLSYLILSRAILGNFFSMGRVGVTIPYSMLNLKFNSFDTNRQTFISNLLEVPALYISEVGENNGFRSGSDGAVMMDQLLESKGSPVIMSLSTSPESFTGHMTYGSVFSDIIETAKVTAYDNHFWRFSLKIKNPCKDPIEYKKQADKVNSKKGQNK